MASLVDLPEIVGFFSYSREDDEDFRRALSALMLVISHELSARLGRSKGTFRLWQDREAIAPGEQWEAKIKSAIAQSVFFIPIVTPRAINSAFCRSEFEAFLDSEFEGGKTYQADKADWLEPFCEKHGLTFCPRRHIEWFGCRRGT